VPALLLCGMAAAYATTLVPMRFDEMVSAAGLVVEATVTDIRTRTTGAILPPAPESSAPSSPTAPVAVGVEGGRKLFTEVTLQVNRQVGGSPASEIRLILAGGASGSDRHVVFGMPQFEMGESYVLLLRPDFERTNVPVVGVSQGFFRISRDPGSGQEMLLNAEGDIVLAVEGDRLATRHNPARAARQTPQLAAAPVPEDGSGVSSGISPRVERYWASTETPIPPGAFLDAVQAMKEARP
jgi:hypothetical protein